MERHLLGFETPLFFGEAQLRVAAACTFQRIGGVHVEHKGPVGPEAAYGHVVERAQFFDVEAAPVALIDHGGVRVAVAEHHFAAFQRRADDLRDVLRPVREEQEQFRLRADFRFRIQEHLAQLPAQRAPAGLARHQHLMVQGTEHVGEVLNERGFARAFNAF